LTEPTRLLCTPVLLTVATGIMNLARFGADGLSAGPSDAVLTPGSFETSTREATMSTPKLPMTAGDLDGVDRLANEWSAASATRPPDLPAALLRAMTALQRFGIAAVRHYSSFVLTRQLRRRPGRSRAISRGLADLGGRRKSSRDQGLAKLRDHVLKGGLGLGVVPRYPDTAYQSTTSDWTSSPNGTVRSTAFGRRLRA
jgi:hypothetical protein